MDREKKAFVCVVPLVHDHHKVILLSYLMFISVCLLGKFNENCYTSFSESLNRCTAYNNNDNNNNNALVNAHMVKGTS